MTDKPQTLQQAIVYFSDKDVAHEYLVALRWSDGVVCPFCEGKEHILKRLGISQRNRWSAMEW